MTQFCAKIAIIGQPNVGKSTLLNALTGSHLAITSPKAQTTETTLLGIMTDQDYQFVFIDTPGIHSRMHQSKNKDMNRQAQRSILDADIVLWLITPQIGRLDKHVAEWLRKHDSLPPLLLLINKSDLPIAQPNLTSLIDNIPITMSMPISAKTGLHVNQLKAWLMMHCPQAPFLYEPHQTSDQSESFQITEIIREQLLLKLNQELPYQCDVVIESDQATPKGRLINAFIQVKDSNHKKIIIGHQGQTIKAISQEARKQIQIRLNTSLHLMLYVKQL